MKAVSEFMHAPLPGNGNDTDAMLSGYIISTTRDFTVHEVA